MANRRRTIQNANRRTPAPQTPVAPATPTIADNIRAIQVKVDRIIALRREIESHKNLYAEHDRLMGELQAEIIQSTPEEYTIKRRLQLGNRTYRIEPFFFDVEKNLIRVKSWKSTAFPTLTLFE